MGVIRTFLAVDLDDAVKYRLHDVVERLRRADADVKWVDSHSMHITLKFVGEIEEAKLEPLKGLLPGAFAGHSRFKLDVRNLGTFPERGGDIRVVWAGLEGDLGKLRALAKAAADAARKIGVPEEARPFSGHVTLGRVKSARGLEKLRQAVERERHAVFGTQEIAEVTLFQSTLTPEGSIYTPLMKIGLR